MTSSTDRNTGISPNDLFDILERNKRRLLTLEYACHGVGATGGKEAACFVGILADIYADLDGLSDRLARAPETP